MKIPQVVKDLFASKKFIATLGGALVGIGAKYGLHLDTEMVAIIMGAVATYVVSQGVADHGAVAAQIKADNPVAPAAPTTVTQVVDTTEGGTVAKSTNVPGGRM